MATKEPNSGKFQACFFSEQSFQENIPIIFTVGLFCCDKFEETTNKKESGLSKLTESYFNATKDFPRSIYENCLPLKSLDYVICKLS